MERADPERLTPIQQAVVNLPASARCLVLGGAGTGKTQVLIERIAKLVSVDSLAPGDEVLVLTFGRETAAELRRRAAAAGGDAAYVRASTFDSFATGLLAFLNPEGTWVDGSYDERIRSADRSIRDHGHAQKYVSQLRHIMVDEIQDLVGVRADFVLTLLRYAKCGFTLLGDPAQAIFNFQLNSSVRERGSEPLFDSLRQDYAGLGTYTLDENFRAQTEQTRSPIGWGLLLGRSDSDYEVIRRELQTLLLRAQPAPLGMLDRRGGTIAILCYTNAQALSVSKELFGKGVDHEYRRALSDRAIASWVGEILGPRTETQLSKSELAELLVEAADAPSIEDAWKTLKAMDTGSHAALRLDPIAQNIRSGAVTGDPPRRRSRITVSTIHRAKGLEFDWAVIVKPGAGNFGGEQIPAEEARMLFVALTRSRKGFFWLEPPDTRGWQTRRDRVEGRWTLVPRRSLEGIEVRGSDIRDDVPPGFFEGSSGESAQGTQLYIRRSVRVGNPVSLRLDDTPGPSGGYLRFRLFHGETVVGETSETFAEALKRVGRLPERRGRPILPLGIEGLRVEAVDTVAGTRAAASRAGLEGLGIWNRVRVFGLGEVVYPSVGSGGRAT